MMNKNFFNFTSKKLTFFFLGILLLCFNLISTDNVGGSLMSLASPNTNNTSSLFVNPIQDKIDASTNLNKLIEKNGKKIFNIFYLNKNF